LKAFFPEHRHHLLQLMTMILLFCPSPHCALNQNFSGVFGRKTLEAAALPQIITPFVPCALSMQPPLKSCLHDNVNSFRRAYSVLFSSRLITQSALLALHSLLSSAVVSDGGLIIPGPASYHRATELKQGLVIHRTSNSTQQQQQQQQRPLPFKPFGTSHSQFDALFQLGVLQFRVRSNAA
jgi:hypothetical protein